MTMQDLSEEEREERVEQILRGARQVETGESDEEIESRIALTSEEEEDTTVSLADEDLGPGESTPSARTFPGGRTKEEFEALAASQRPAEVELTTVEPTSIERPSPPSRPRRRRRTGIPGAGIARGALATQRGFTAPEDTATTEQILEESISGHDFGPSVDPDKDILGIGLGQDPFEGSDAVDLFIPTEDFVTAFHGEQSSALLRLPVAIITGRKNLTKPSQVGDIIILQVLQTRTNATGFRIRWREEEFDWFPEKETLVQAEARS